MSDTPAISTALYTVRGARLAPEGMVDVELFRADGSGVQTIRVAESDMPPFRATVEASFRVVATEPDA